VPTHRRLSGLAFLAACAAITATPPPNHPYHHVRSDDGPIRLTVNEIRRLFTNLVNTIIRTVEHRLHWSLWRRTHPSPPLTLQTTPHSRTRPIDHEVRLPY
jgi:hypothetical protein